MPGSLNVTFVYADGFSDEGGVDLTRQGKKSRGFSRSTKKLAIKAHSKQKPANTTAPILVPRRRYVETLEDEIGFDYLGDYPLIRLSIMLKHLNFVSIGVAEGHIAQYRFILRYDIRSGVVRYEIYTSTLQEQVVIPHSRITPQMRQKIVELCYRVNPEPQPETEKILSKPLKLGMKETPERMHIAIRNARYSEDVRWNPHAKNATDFD